MYGDYVVKMSGVLVDDGACLIRGVLSRASDGLCDGGVRNGCLVMCRDGLSDDVRLFDVENGDDRIGWSARSTWDECSNRGVSS